MTTIPGKYDLTIVQGTTFTRTIIYKDAVGDAVNLTGHTVRMQAREDIGSSITFIDIDSATKGGITLTPLLGQINLRLTPVQTALITKGGYYDIEVVTPGGDVARLLKGIITVDPEVTR